MSAQGDIVMQLLILETYKSWLFMSLIRLLAQFTGE